MSAPPDPRFERAVTKLRLLFNDATVRIVTLYVLSGLCGILAILHYILFTEGGAPSNVHIVLLTSSFFIAMYLSLTPTH